MKIPRIPRVMSAPGKLENIVVTETIKQVTKSVSYQFLSELTQLTVEDIKNVNEEVSELGSNFNEIAQSSIDVVEGNSTSKNIFITMVIRLAIGGFAHIIHDITIKIYSIINDYFYS